MKMEKRRNMNGNKLDNAIKDGANARSLVRLCCRRCRVMAKATLAALEMALCLLDLAS
jgi:hypothetical protein